MKNRPATPDRPGSTKKPTKKGGTPGKSGRKASRRELGLLVGLVVMLALLVLPRLGAGEAVPVELYGRWTTDDPRYNGRVLVITDSSVAFYMGQDPISVHRIRRSHTQPAEVDGVQYDIEYDTDGEPQSLSLIYGPPPAEVVRLKSQPEMEWTRAGSK